MLCYANNYDHLWKGAVISKCRNAGLTVTEYTTGWSSSVAWCMEGSCSTCRPLPTFNLFILPHESHCSYLRTTFSSTHRITYESTPNHLVAVNVLHESTPNPLVAVNIIAHHYKVVSELLQSFQLRVDVQSAQLLLQPRMERLHSCLH